MSIFTLLPANKVESLALMYVENLPSMRCKTYIPSALQVVVVCISCLKKRLLVHSASTEEADKVSTLILGSQVILVALEMLATRSSVTSLQGRQGLSETTQLFGWAILSKSCGIRLISTLVVV